MIMVERANDTMSAKDGKHGVMQKDGPGLLLKLAFVRVYYDGSDGETILEKKYIKAREMCNAENVPTNCCVHRCLCDVF